MRIQSLITFWNRKEYAKMCLETYLASTKVPHILVLADNGSTDGTKEYLKQVECDYLTHKLETNGIKLVFRYYRKNYGPIRVENHLVRNPIESDTYYFIRSFHDVHFSKMCEGDWLEKFVKLMDAIPEIACVAPTDGRWSESNVETKNGERFIGGSAFEWSELIKMTRKEVYVQFGRPMFNMWATTPSYFTATVRSSVYGEGLKWITAVHPDVRLINLVDELHLESDNELYKKQHVISRRIFSKNRAFMDATRGILEWDQGGRYSYDLNELVGEAMCLESHMDQEQIEAQMDNGVTENDIKLVEKDGYKYIAWERTKKVFGIPK